MLTVTPNCSYDTDADSDFYTAWLSTAGACGTTEGGSAIVYCASSWWSFKMNYCYVAGYVNSYLPVVYLTTVVLVWCCCGASGPWVMFCSIPEADGGS